MRREHHPPEEDARPDGRRAPVIGDLRGLRFERPARPPTGGDADPARTWWIVAFAVATALVLVAVLWREPLAERIWPENRVQRLSGEAEEALASGHLSSSDGSGARELYEAAMAIDPDRTEPRAGLARVADAALQQARVALREQRYPEAHAALQLARELSVPREQADAFAAELRRREAAGAGLQSLVANAEAARVAGRLDGGDDAALPLYARVLELQPDRADALRGREDALSALLEQAREDLRGGDVAKAAVAIATARQYDPGHVDLPDTQARFTEELDALRRRADADLRRGRIDASVATWQRLLQYDPDDEEAKAGLRAAADAQAVRAQQLAADFRFEEADDALAQARALAPDAGTVAAATAAVERGRRRHAQRQVADARDVRRVPGLLRDARAAEARGDLLTPPGESAYDKLRIAQSIAPRDPAVRRAVARLLPSARECFERGLSANDLARARRCLDARESLGEDAAAMAAARRRLAQRWLAIGDERLAGGQLAAAGQALQTARALDPSTPELEEFDQRLRTATGDAD